LIDLQGKVMGILTPINPGIVTEGEVEQWYDSGIGFAIPLTDVLERLPKMQAGQDIYPGKVGIRWRGEDEYSQPVMIEGVTPGSPAAEGGLEIGDKVVAAGPSATNLKPVANHSQFKHAMGPLDAGMQLVLVVERGSDRKEITATLAREMPLYKEPYLGILIDPASAANAPKVSYIVPGSPAAGSGLRSGWVIESINGVRIDEKRSLENQLANLNYRVALELEVRDGAGVASRIKLDPSTRREGDFEWDFQPEVAPEAANEPAAEPSAEPAEGKSQVGTIQIPISDVKNKAFAIVPSNYSQKVPHGLLVLFGDAGSLDQSKWAAAWEPFAREHRWIIAVAQSSDEKGWSFEEVEVGMRMQTWLARTYSIDRRRIAVGGFDSGAILAYITAAQFPELFRGVWLSNPKAPRGLRINPSEPFKAASYFVNSSDKGVDAFVERIRKNGYSVQRQGSDLDSSKLVLANCEK
jgi:serine protease Do